MQVRSKRQHLEALRQHQELPASAHSRTHLRITHQVI